MSKKNKIIYFIREETKGIKKREPLVEATSSNARYTPKGDVRYRPNLPRSGNIGNYATQSPNITGNSKAKVGSMKDLLSPSMKQFDEYVDRKETLTQQRATSSPKKISSLTIVTSQAQPGSLQNLFITKRRLMQEQGDKKNSRLHLRESPLRQFLERGMSPSPSPRKDSSPEKRTSLSPKFKSNGKEVETEENSPKRVKSIKSQVYQEEEKESKDQAKQHQFVRVLHWQDDGDNYGLAYSLSNRNVGILFNDNTKLLLDAEEK